MMKKTCRECGNSEPRVTFSLDSKSKDGRRNICQNCDAKASKERRELRTLEVAASKVGWLSGESGGIVSARSLEHELTSSLKKVLFIPDCHHPYADQDAWKLMLKAAHQFKPDIVVILGDFTDMYSVSDHDKYPGRVTQLQDELAFSNQRLDEVDELGADEKIYISGNHEFRLDRYLMRRAPELHGLLSVKEALNLTKRGWKFVEYMDSYRLGKIIVTHDLERASRYAVYSAMQDAGHSVVIGHLHRVCTVVEGDATGERRIGACFGWLGDFSRVDYKHRIRALRDWAHGFGLGYVQGNGVVHIVSVPIVKNSCVIEGQLITL